jgi:large subunit ribosomal protein L32e
MAHRFLRQDWMRASKFGKRRKNKLTWRRPKGIHSKMRLRRTGYPSVPLIGGRTPTKQSGKIKGFVPVLVHNMKEISSLKKGEAAIIARVGARNRIELLKKAEELHVKVLNSSIREASDFAKVSNSTKMSEVARKEAK